MVSELNCMRTRSFPPMLIALPSPSSIIPGKPAALQQLAAADQLILAANAASQGPLLAVSSLPMRLKGGGESKPVMAKTALTWQQVLAHMLC